MLDTKGGCSWRWEKKGERDSVAVSVVSHSHTASHWYANGCGHKRQKRQIRTARLSSSHQLSLTFETQTPRRKTCPSHIINTSFQRTQINTLPLFLASTQPKQHPPKQHPPKNTRSDLEQNASHEGRQQWPGQSGAEECSGGTFCAWMQWR